MRAHIKSDSRGRRQALKPCLEPCAIERGMRILGGKWTGSILWHLKDSPVRFNDLARMIGGASKKMITERLKLLESEGLVKRHVLAERPLGVAYEISTQGRTALNFLDELRKWSEARSRSQSRRSTRRAQTKATPARQRL